MLKQILAVTLAAAALSAVAADRRDVVLDVKGMTCAACPITVKTVLRKQAGVDAVKVDFDKHTADVKFDPAKVSPEQLARAVTEAGFPASPRK